MGVWEFIGQKLLMIVLFIVALVFAVSASFAATAGSSLLMWIFGIIALVAIIASAYYARQ